jgi:hypothetical protein
MAISALSVIMATIVSERPARAAYPTSGGQSDVWQPVAKAPLHSTDALGAPRGSCHGLRGCGGSYLSPADTSVTCTSGLRILGGDSASCYRRYAPWAQRYTPARNGFLRTMTHTDGGEGRG